MRLRAPTVDDAPAVCALIARREVVDFGAAETTAEQVLHAWRAPGFTLAVDAVVAEDHGGPIGYGGVAGRNAFVTVLPEREGAGVGTELLAWVERRERELGRPVHRQWHAGTNEAARALLTAAGYACVRSYVRMNLSLHGFAMTSELPAGVRLRAPDPDGDAAALHALDEASFSVVPDYLPESLEMFRLQHLQNPEFDPALSLVAEHDGQIVGFLIGNHISDETTGYIDILAVGPKHQRQGLGRGLLLDAFARFAAAGLTEAALGVASDNPRACALYEQVGMRPQFRRETVERPNA